MLTLTRVGMILQRAMSVLGGSSLESIVPLK